MGDNCVVCKKEIEKKDRDYAENQENHIGILGLVDPSCYGKANEEEPDLPWTDPISGEVDYEDMAEDLGVSFGDEEDWESEKFYP